MKAMGAALARIATPTGCCGMACGASVEENHRLRRQPPEGGPRTPDGAKPAILQLKTSLVCFRKTGTPPALGLTPPRTGREHAIKCKSFAIV
ncbi:MAG: hypothetical protein Q4A97_07475 [Comamonadaceae bacterium]|nr:hypothetical protein [Comamonadaceae bacterium]